MMCTSLTITATNQHQIMGRTMDFPTKTPWQLTFLPAGYQWQPITDYQPLQTKHALLGGMRYTHHHYLIGDAVNDHGLAVAELYFPVEAHYFDQPVAGKINLSPQDFTTWLLSEHNSVAAIKQHLSQVALVGVPWYDQEAIYPFHWLITDKTGTYLIEPTQLKLSIIRNPFNILTNTPNLGKQATNLNRFLHISSESGEATTISALSSFTGKAPDRSVPTDRFVKTALWRFRDAPLLPHLDSHTLISFLTTVQIPKQNDRHDYTHYFGAIDTNELIYYFKGVIHPALTTVRLNDLIKITAHPLILAKE